MRRCAMHIQENNCPDANCTGLLNDTHVDDVQPEAHERLADFADVVSEADELPPQDSSDASAEFVGADNGGNSNPRE